MTKLYENIKALCKANHTSIRKLQVILGFPMGTISNWSNTLPSCRRVIAVAHYFNVSVDFLLGEDINPNNNPYAQSILQAAERLEVNEEISTIVIKMMEVLKEQLEKR